MMFLLFCYCKSYAQSKTNNAFPVNIEPDFNIKTHMSKSLVSEFFLFFIFKKEVQRLRTRITFS